MKLNKLTKEQAEEIIVYGEDKAFSMITIKDIPLTIYHREYKGKHYDIAEMNTYIVYKEETITTFYQLDPEEVKKIIGGNTNDN